MDECKVCNTQLTGRQTLYCSNKCKNSVSNNKNQQYASQQARGIRTQIRANETI